MIMNQIKSFDPDNNEEHLAILRYLIYKYVFYESRQAQFYELNNFVINSIESGIPTVLIDMPEIVLRMQIANKYTLVELNEIFNAVANKINRREVVPDPHIAA